MVISIDERNPVRLLDKQNIPCEIRFYMEFMIPGMHIRVGMEAIKTGEEDENCLNFTVNLLCNAICLCSLYSAKQIKTLEGW